MKQPSCLWNVFVTQTRFDYTAIAIFEAESGRYALSARGWCERDATNALVMFVLFGPRDQSNALPCCLNYDPAEALMLHGKALMGELGHISQARDRAQRDLIGPLLEGMLPFKLR